MIYQITEMFFSIILFFFKFFLVELFSTSKLLTWSPVHIIVLRLKYVWNRYRRGLT